MHAVAIAHGPGLTLQVEHVATTGAVRQLTGAVMQVLPISDRLITFAVAHGRIDAGQQAAAVPQTGGLHRGLQFVRGPEGRHGGVVVGRADKQRAMLGAEVPARADIGGTEDRITDTANEPNVIGDIAFAGPHSGENGTEVGSIRRGARLAAEQVVHGVEVVADVPDVRHRADQGKMLGQGGKARVQFADAHARDGRGNRPIGAANAIGCIRLEVPGVEVARPTAQEHEDTGLLRRDATRGLVIDARRHHPRKGHRHGADPAGLKQLTARAGGTMVWPLNEGFMLYFLEGG